LTAEKEIRQFVNFINQENDLVIKMAANVTNAMVTSILD